MIRVAFHIIFVKTVPDVSLNAVVNLGYVEGVLAVAGVSRRHTAISIRGHRRQAEFQREIWRGLYPRPLRDRVMFG